MIKNAFVEGFYKAAGAREDLGEYAYNAILKQHVGERGFFGSLANAVGNKVLGKVKTHRIQRAITKVPLEVDTRVGKHLDKVMQKLPVGKDFFKLEETIKAPASHGKNMKQIIKRTSATAPLVKATEVAKPIVFGLAIDKAVRSLKDKRNGKQSEKDSRSKTAPATY